MNGKEREGTPEAIYEREGMLQNSHFNIAVNKANRYLCQLVGALSKYWGPQTKLVKWIFTAVVKPRITYAALVWAHSIQTI